MSSALSVFISHSGKDLEPLERLQADPERFARLTFLRRVRDGIVADERLKDRLELWFDRERLEPGMQWRSKLHRQLASCHAAVILLNPESLASDWVRTEATFLTWRKLRWPELEIIPVLLGDTSWTALESAGWGPLQLTESQPVMLASPALDRTNARSLIDQVASRLLKLAPAASADNALDRWIEDVEIALQDLDVRTLWRAAEKLHVDHLDWDADEPARCRGLIATQLLTSDAETIRRALLQLTTAMTDERRARLVGLVVPTWVSFESARTLLTTSAGPVDERVVAVNTSAVRLGKCYVERAGCSAPEYIAIAASRPITSRSARQSGQRGVSTTGRCRGPHDRPELPGSEPARRGGDPDQPDFPRAESVPAR